MRQIRRRPCQIVGSSWRLAASGSDDHSIPFSAPVTRLPTKSLLSFPIRSVATIGGERYVNVTNNGGLTRGSNDSAPCDAQRASPTSSPSPSPPFVSAAAAKNIHPGLSPFNPKNQSMDRMPPGKVLSSSLHARYHDPEAEAAYNTMNPPPYGLSVDQLAHYREHGFVVIENAVDPKRVAKLAEAVRAAARRRGGRFVPASDRQHQPNNAEITAELKQQLPPDQHHKVQADGSHVASFERREKKIKIKCRNKKEMDRAYKKIVELRRRYADYKHLDVKERTPTPSGSHGESTTTESGGTGNSSTGFTVDPRDDVDVRAFNENAAKKSFEQYKSSGKMEKDIRKGSHLDDALSHIYNGAQSWAHVWAGDAALREALFEGYKKMNESASVAEVLGGIGAQLAGVLTTRLYTDTIIQRTPLCNAVPFHHDASGINFRDARGLHATVVLPPPHGAEATAQPLDEDHGGFVVLPGSHRVIQRLTHDCRDLSAFLRPPAWELGEVLRPYNQLTSIRPLSLGALVPGSVLFFSNLLVYSNNANMAVHATSTARDVIFSQCHRNAGNAASMGPDGSPVSQRGDLVDLSMDEAPLTYALSIMPDGVVFDGCRNTWMSKDSHGPLFRFEEGQPLRGKDTFPVLFSELPEDE